MADYIYLLENRLSAGAAGCACLTVREVARAKGLTVFLVGGAVRDLTSGSPVRDLDVVVQGNALKLKKDIEKAGGVITGENEAGQALFVRFPGGVRMEIGSTLSVTYPKPGKPVVKPATILDDLRRRDFTANAMALSLNDGLVRAADGSAERGGGHREPGAAAGEQLRVHRGPGADDPGGAVYGAAGLADGREDPGAV